MSHPCTVHLHSEHFLASRSQVALPLFQSMRETHVVSLFCTPLCFCQRNIHNLQASRFFGSCAGGAYVPYCGMYAISKVGSREPVLPIIFLALKVDTHTSQETRRMRHPRKTKILRVIPLLDKEGARGTCSICPVPHHPLTASAEEGSYFQGSWHRHRTCHRRRAALGARGFPRLRQGPPRRRAGFRRLLRLCTRQDHRRAEARRKCIGY